MRLRDVMVEKCNEVTYGIRAVDTMLADDVIFISEWNPPRPLPDKHSDVPWEWEPRLQGWVRQGPWTPQRYRGYTQRYLCVDDQSVQRAAEIDLDYMLKYLEFWSRHRCKGLQGAVPQLVKEALQWKEGVRTTEQIRSKTQELSDKTNTLQRE